VPVVSVQGLKGDRFVALLGTVGAARDVETPLNSASKLAASRLILYDAILERLCKIKCTRADETLRLRLGEFKR